jgi:hypothetical protein
VSTLRFVDFMSAVVISRYYARVTTRAVQGSESVASDNLRAAVVVIHHREDLFDPTHSELKMIPGGDVNRSCERLLAGVGGDKSRVHILAPRVLRNFPRHAGSVAAGASPASTKVAS